MKKSNPRPKHSVAIKIDEKKCVAYNANMFDLSVHLMGPWIYPRPHGAVSCAQPLFAEQSCEQNDLFESEWLSARRHMAHRKH
jgi:hypothetical protein